MAHETPVQSGSNRHERSEKTKYISGGTDDCFLAVQSCPAAPSFNLPIEATLPASSGRSRQNFGAQGQDRRGAARLDAGERFSISSFRARRRAAPEPPRGSARLRLRLRGAGAPRRPGGGSGRASCQPSRRSPGRRGETFRNGITTQRCSDSAMLRLDVWPQPTKLWHASARLCTPISINGVRSAGPRVSWLASD